MDHSELEELGLFGSQEITRLEDERDPQFNDAGASATAVSESLHHSRPSSSIVYDQLRFPGDEDETTLYQLDLAGVDLLSSDARNSHVRHESNLVNAVHMHVQDNARIPNYNLPVDRSNSNNTSASDALLSSKLELNNYAELFLSSESDYRKSLNQSYEVRSTLLSDVPKEIEGLAAVSFDPTPWSEIKDKIHIEEENEKQQQQRRQQVQNHHQQQQQIYVGTSAPVPGTPTISPRAATTLYPNDRQQEIDLFNGKKIPSPEKNTAEQEVARMADAIATAAAIALTTNGAATVVNNNASISPAKQSKPKAVSWGESSTSTTPSNSAVNPIKTEVNYSHDHDQHLQRQYPNTMPPPRAAAHAASRASVLAATNRKSHDNLYTRDRRLQRQRANAKAPPHAAAHAVSRASLLAATNRKSQYGFGGNHTVPSVPAPPSLRSSNQSMLNHFTAPKTKPKAKKASVTPSVKPVPTPPPHIPNGSHPVLHGEGHTGSAYERKKQKAKDARVRLNEAIECLAVAVNLAGSQSKLRIDQLQNQIHPTEIRQKTIEVNQEGIKLSESAKKWDRPSFVGTAASIIKALNAQCETLMAELMAMQQMLDESKGMNGGSNNDDKVKPEDSTRDNGICDAKMAASPTDFTNSEVSRSVSEQAESPNSHQVQKRYTQSAVLSKNVQSPHKRPRLDINEDQNMSCIDEVCWGKMSKLVSEWLDPLSLCRCQCTSKGWRDMNAFGNEKIWFDLAVKRFGLYNVRKWSDHLKDEESEEIHCKDLYMEMNDKNVMPYFSREGLLFLGNGKIKGKLSAWVFIVERSNGETLRSVKRDPSSGTLRGVGYQSRPVVELRIVIQNIGMFTHPAIINSQKVEVDASTRRTDTKFEEIYWDDRFNKVLRNTDGTIRTLATIHSNSIFQDELCRLEYLETAVIEVHINAQGCSTISKFRKRSNFTTILANLDGTTVPMVIPFLKHNDMF